MRLDTGLLLATLGYASERSNMEFSEFAKILHPIIGAGSNVDDFACELFENIVEYPGQDESPIDKKSMKSYKAYYLGDRKITAFSKEIRKYVEPTSFESYIADMPEEAQMSIYQVLAEHVSGMTDQNIAEKTAELFKSIIYEASTKKRTSKKDKENKVPEANALVVGEKDYYLLDECNSSCPLCGDKLVKTIGENIKNRYRRVYIMPPSIASYEREEIEAAVGIKVGDNLLAISNQLLLCEDCADENEVFSKDVYNRLANIKVKLMKRKNTVDTIDEIVVEEGINLILKSFTEMKDAPIEIKKDDLEVFRVDRKIPDNIFLRETVTGMVLRYYRHIEDLFKQYERRGLLRFNKIKNEISQCFESLDEQDLNQQEIFDAMVQWLQKQSKCKNLPACEIIIAFFVQNCEVFYEIAE